MSKLLKRSSALLGLCLLLASPVTQAHVLKQDNGVSAVLHIAPFDAPTSNTPTRLEIEFSNTANTFALNQYHIALRLMENGQLVKNYPVAAAYFGTASEGLATVTFPKADVYEVKLSGTPVVADQPGFAMQYEVRVTAAVTAASTNSLAAGSAVLLFGLAGFVLFCMFAIYRIVAGKRYSKSSKVIKE